MGFLTESLIPLVASTCFQCPLILLSATLPVSSQFPPKSCNSQPSTLDGMRKNWTSSTASHTAGNMQLTTQYSGWNEKELGFFSSIPHSWESQTCTHVLWPSPAGKTTNQEGLFWHWAVPLWRIYDLGKVKPFLPPHLSSGVFSFLPWYAGDLDLYRGFLIRGLSTAVSSRGSWTATERGWSGFMVTAGSTARTEVRVPVVQGTGKRAFSQAPR